MVSSEDEKILFLFVIGVLPLAGVMSYIFMALLYWIGFLNPPCHSTSLYDHWCYTDVLVWTVLAIIWFIVTQFIIFCLFEPSPDMKASVHHGKSQKSSSRNAKSAFNASSLKKSQKKGNIKTASVSQLAKTSASSKKNSKLADASNFLETNAKQAKSGGQMAAFSKQKAQSSLASAKKNSNLAKAASSNKNTGLAGSSSSMKTSSKLAKSGSQMAAGKNKKNGQIAASVNPNKKANLQALKKQMKAASGASVSAAGKIKKFHFYF